MAITIDGTGSISGISAGGIPDGCVDTDVLANNAVTYAKIGTTEQGQLCKAWVNFNGTSTVAIRASYNVSSITDNGTGDYTVNFTTAMPDANYSTLVSAGGVFSGDTAQGYGNLMGTTGTYSTAAVRVGAYRTDADALVDASKVMVAIFR